MKAEIVLLIRLFLYRMKQNKISMSAGYLTYSTMLAIVPLIMVVFSVFTLFPIFDEASGALKSFIYSNFAPNLGDIVSQYLDLFVSNSQKMGAFSSIGLVVVALMLISTIDNSLNDIWLKTKNRPIWLSFLLYAALLIVAPILAGLSITISSYVLSLEIFSPDSQFSISHHLLKLLPFILTWLMFTFVYMLVPNTKVQFKQAASGALFAGIFFTLGKQIFIWYITTFPSYQAIYGALATLPIMILWVYLSWKVVLLGGQFAAVLKELNLIKAGELTSPLTKKEQL